MSGRPPTLTTPCDDNLGKWDRSLSEFPCRLGVLRRLGECHPAISDLPGRLSPCCASHSPVILTIFRVDAPHLIADALMRGHWDVSSSVRSSDAPSPLFDRPTSCLRLGLLDGPQSFLASGVERSGCNCLPPQACALRSERPLVLFLGRDRLSGENEGPPQFSYSLVALPPTSISSTELRLRDLAIPVGLRPHRLLRRSLYLIAHHPGAPPFYYRVLARIKVINKIWVQKPAVPV